MIRKRTLSTCVRTAACPPGAYVSSGSIPTKGVGAAFIQVRETTLLRGALLM